jgi:hypothetical protein
MTTRMLRSWFRIRTRAAMRAEEVVDIRAVDPES